MTKVLECKNLHKNFGKKEILKDLSFDMDAGEIFGFIGPNGAGKTTTIKLILGLQRITSGTIKINGKDIEDDFTEAIAKVGAIVENPDLYMYLSGRKNLELAARMYKDVDASRIDEVIKLVGLEKRINDKVNKYSLGMRQRLGIAQAILHHPNILILDEPNNGLDPEGIKSLRLLLQKLAKEEKMAILISSHNLAELESFITKVCIIKNGVIIANEDIKKYKKQAITSTYLFEVSNIKEAVKLVKGAKLLSDDSFEVEIDREKISETIKKLIDKDINIYQVYEQEASLEEAFLKQTGGNIID